MKSEIKNAYIAGYETGHNDTVESQYTDSNDLAEDYWIAVGSMAHDAVLCDALLTEINSLDIYDYELINISSVKDIIKRFI